MTHRILLSLTLLLLTLFTNAEETTRLVLLRVPVKEAALIRVELNDATKGSKSEAMDALLKVLGIKELAQFQQTNPWRNEPIAMKLPKDAEFFDLTKPSLFVSMDLAGGELGGGHEEILASAVDLPMTTKKYQSFQNLGNVISPLSGRWQERTSWADEKEAMMVWQYSMVDRKPYVRTAHEKPKEYFKVEMKWYQVTKEDLAILGAAKPEAREKASLWVTKRAKLWKEGMFRLCASLERQAGWMFNDGKIVGRGEEAAVDEDRFCMMTRFTRRDDFRSVEFEFRSTNSKGGDELIQKKDTIFTPGAWDFQVIEEMQGANVMIYRFSKE